MSDHEGPWSSPPPQRPPPAPARSGRLPIFALLLVAGLALIFWLSTFFPGHVGGTSWTTSAISVTYAAVIGASLFSRGLKLGQAVRYVAVWGVIVGVLALGYVYRQDAEDAFLRVRSALIPAYATEAGADTVVLSETQDGDYQVVGKVNGQPVTFAVDTGASDVVLSPADARRLGIDPATLKFNHSYETANGAGLGADWRADSVAVGRIQVSGMTVSVNRTDMSRSLLGMAFLHRLRSFEFRGGQLVLRGPARQ
jgi:aspartyl protease family protein